MLRIGVSASDNRNPGEMVEMSSTHPFDENGDGSFNAGKTPQVDHPEPATCNDPQVAHPEASQAQAVHSKSLSDTSLQASPTTPSLKRIIPNASAKHPPIQVASQVLSEQSWLHIGKMDVLIMIIVAKMALAMKDARRAIRALELALRACRNSCAALSLLGPLLLQQGHYLQATEVFQYLIGLDQTAAGSKMVDWLSCLGYSLLACGNTTPSFSSFQQALKYEESKHVSTLD